MKNPALAFTNYTGTWPNVLARDITVTGDGTGTEWKAAFVDETWGSQQHLMEKANLAPDGVTETNGASQLYVAMQRCFGNPGELVPWLGSGDPATSDIRMLVLDGSVVAIADYPDLVAETYIGDTNNPDTDYIGFYKTSDAGGTTRDTAGIYFKLPDYRGAFIRGTDPSAARDPAGVGRGIPQIQSSAFETHGHELLTATTNNYAVPGTLDTGAVFAPTFSTGGGSDRLQARDQSGFVIGGTPNDYETRPINLNARLCVRY